MRGFVVPIVLASLAAQLFACAEAGDVASIVETSPTAPPQARASSEDTHALIVHDRIGNALDDIMRAEGPGLVVVGGVTNVDDAFVWMRKTIGCTRVSAGDIVVLRIDDDDTYAQYVADRGAFNSVQTIVVSRDATTDDFAVAAHIVDFAEGIVLVSEDPGAILRWRGTPLVDAVQRAFERGGVVAALGGGATVLGQFAYDTRQASSFAQSADALANPYESSIAFARDTFRFPQLEGFVVDAHFRQGDRFGRLAAFMARQVGDDALVSHPPRAVGIGVDDANALTIDRFGRVSLLQATGAEGGAFVVVGGTPTQIVPNAPLIYRDLVVARLDAPGETFDLERGCGTAFVYTVTVDATATSVYAPANPYEARGFAYDCAY
jgi:cyanophycinase-like exopeptidase